MTSQQRSLVERDLHPHRGLRLQVMRMQLPTACMNRDDLHSIRCLPQCHRQVLQHQHVCQRISSSGKPRSKQFLLRIVASLLISQFIFEISSFHLWPFALAVIQSAHHYRNADLTSGRKRNSFGSHNYAPLGRI